MARRIQRTHRTSDEPRTNPKLVRIARRMARDTRYRRIHFERLEDRLLLASDFGDAPVPYPTLLISNGARHEAIGPRLGPSIDTEADGQISLTLAGDDGAGSDDEDGVSFSAIHVGQLNATATVEISLAPEAARLDAWIDFNGDGTWDSAEDQIAASIAVVNGTNTISFSVPSDITPGQKVARFRLSTAGGLSPIGPAADGEIEDHAVTIAAGPPAIGLFGYEHIAFQWHNDVSTVASGDLDGDGDVDLVTSSSSQAGIWWSENDGNGVFVNHVLFATAGETAKVRTVDVDLDGDLDVISAGESANAVVWHENLSGGVFQSHAISATHTTSTDIWASDIDSDGDVDLLVGHQSGTFWYENNGAQQFSARTVGGPPYNISAVRSADLDRDGNLDIVLAARSSPALAWLRNEGAGQFFSQPIVTTSNLIIGDIQVGDLDHDGDLDIVASYVGGTTTSVIRWYRNNSGVFQENQISTWSDLVFSIELADVDNDADLDIIAGTDRGSAGAIFWYKNTGLGSFGTPIKILGSGSVRQVIAADLDDDGDSDLVSAIADRNASVIASDRLGWFENSEQVVSLGSAELILDPEGSHPEFGFSLARAGNLSVPLTVKFEILGTATFNSDYSLSGAATFDGERGTIVFPANSGYVSIAFVVHDDDVYEPDENLQFRLLELDAYALDDSATSAKTWTVVDDEPGDFGDAPATYPTLDSQNGPRHGATGPQLGTTRDAELDGQPTANAAGDDEAADPSGGIAFDNVRAGSQSAIARVYVENAPTGARIDAWVDFDRDGQWSDNGEQILAHAIVQDGWNELRFAVPTTALSGPTFARIRLSTAGGLGLVGDALDGEVEDVTITVLPPEATPGKFAYGGLLGVHGITHIESVDIDRDGDLDLVWTSLDYSLRGVQWTENVNGNFTTKPATNLDIEAEVFSVGDLDNDGDVDILTARSNASEFSKWWQNDGTGVFAEHSVVPLDAPYYFKNAIQLHDLDQDGDLDVIATPNRGFAFLENLGAGQFLPRTPRTSGPEVVGVPVDLDRDGDVDFVKTGTKIWLENTGAYKFTERTFPTVYEGEFVAWIVVDMDHDGYLDVVGNTNSRSKLAWWRNNGNRTFTPRYTDFQLAVQKTYVGPVGLTVGDVDGDGFGDIVNTFNADYLNQRGVNWYKNDGAGNLTHRFFQTDATPYTLEAAHLADVDNDGDLDFLGTAGFEQDQFSAAWYENVSTGVTLTVTPQSAAESNAEHLIFTFQRTDTVVNSLTVEFSVSGTAIYGVEYTAAGAASFSTTGGTIEFPIGVDTIQVIITPTNDTTLESNETVILSLADGHDYVGEGASKALGTIIDNEPGDFGDAPAPYPTTRVENGARHVAAGPKLGLLRDQETDGNSTPAAGGDDLTGARDEDGVQFGIVRVGQANATVDVHVAGAPNGAYLDAWIDFNRDGSWGGLLEAIATRVFVQNGDNTITFQVPSTALSGDTFARFRLSSSGGLSPSGAAPDGEVEDYSVSIVTPISTTASFSSAQVIGGQYSSSHLVAADVDRDGDVDLVSLTRANRRLSWYANDGQGAFTEHLIDSPESGYEFAVVDLDGDGDLDIAAIVSSDDIAQYLNDGHGAFVKSPLPYLQQSGIRALTAADFDGDADTDLLVGVGSGSGNLITWLENLGPAGFVGHHITDETGNIKSMDVADLDGDGDLDLVSASNWWDDGVNWYENNGHAQFTYHRLTSPSYPDFVRIADIDGDGDGDILATGEDLWAYVNDGNGNFEYRYLSYLPADSVTPADLDGDGDVDLLASVDLSTHALYLFRNDGLGYFAAERFASSADLDFGATVADLNGDGALDVLATGTLAWYQNLSFLPGDFNHDQVVDAADYSLWRDANGSIVDRFTGADASGDGLVSQADYDLWRANFGRSSATPAASGGAGAITALADTPSASDNQHTIHHESSPTLEISHGEPELRLAASSARSLISLNTQPLHSQFHATTERQPAGPRFLKIRPTSFANSTGGAVRDQAILAWLAQWVKISSPVDADDSDSRADWDSADSSAESQGIAWGEFASCEPHSRLSLASATH